MVHTAIIFNRMYINIGIQIFWYQQKYDILASQISQYSLRYYLALHTDINRHSSLNYANNCHWVSHIIVISCTITSS